MHVKLMLFALILGSCLLSETRAYCSLDKMKAFAMEACERLFQKDEPRERRSIDSSWHHKNKLSHGKMDKKTPHGVKRSSFPTGGYLKVSSDHYHRLIHLDVLPRYKPLKHNQDKRHKRDSSDKRYNNISYCCFNRCNEDFFC
ncbi:hypothetical protein AWZ03_009241 [Drosophila navojoa]|uniref:Insulin-like domain-containing protein n=1 Tax=Drosophila navojoa TaxID=7232 RepID=A0A484B940_DRONA|nr:uncharacterized protein LOC115563470 [Drosophila navojoa]TDG44351.1 hypothetical protein AWZ03_009241 [Drosophila navojoa]